MEQKVDIDSVINILKEKINTWQKPIVSELVEIERNPYKVLIATIISLRTKDEITKKVSNNLFEIADTPQKMLNLSKEKIAELIYPANYYLTKAKNIIKVSEILVKKYNGYVPNNLNDLLELPGVGRKTANLVLTLGFQELGICVDTHVHRISNRLGFIKTKNATETEFALRKILDKKYWIEYNDLLVAFGQNICKPISPLCSECPISKFCYRIGVKKSR